jgi:thiamine-monophosphate kinase
MINELKLLSEILPKLHGDNDVKVGPGDDCAVVEHGGVLVLLAVDQLIGNVHYLFDETEPEIVGAKLLKRNLSDIAAMGGTPRYALVALASSNAGLDWLRRFFAGLEAEAVKYNVSIVGGDISSSKKGMPPVASLTICGYVKHGETCLRSNAVPGNLLYATGKFGNSFKSGHHLDFSPRLEEARFLAGKFTNTMIDVSDGLLQDSRRLAVASGCGLILDSDQVPLRDGADIEAALTEGEDYELLFAVSREKFQELENSWPFEDVPLTRIGMFTGSPQGEVVDSSGKRLIDIYGKEGFQHEL